MIRWFRRGGKNARLIKVLALIFMWYWLLHFLAQPLKITVAAVFLTALFVYVRWLGHRKARSIRLAGMDEIDQMSGPDFEQKVLLHLCDLGWKAERMRTTADFGADFILTDPGGKRFVARCKRCDEAAGLDVVQEVGAAVKYYQVDGAMIVTNNYLTPAAKQLADVNEVAVWDRDQLAASLAANRASGGTKVWTSLKLLLRRARMKQT